MSPPDLQPTTNSTEHACHQQLHQGNRESTTNLLDTLTPRCLGTLLTLHEHKTICQGIISQINSFDQWGVELGKVLAESIYPELEGPRRHQHDPLTNGLIELLQHQIYLGKLP